MLSLNEQLIEQVSKGDLDAVRRLVIQGADVNIARNEYHETALMIACHRGDEPIVDYLLAIPGINLHLDSESPNYQTALMFAAEKYDTIVKKFEAIPGFSQDGRACHFLLWYYAEKGNLAKAQHYREQGADINFCYLGSYVLHEAIVSPNEDLAIWLLSIPGINVNVLMSATRTSPLVMAILRQRLSVIDALLEREDVDLHVQDTHYGTALTTALFLGDIAVAKKLLCKETKFKGSDYPEAVNWAVRKRSLEMVQLFSEHGADFNQEGGDGLQDVPDYVFKYCGPSDDECPFGMGYYHDLGDLPLKIAVRNGHTEMVELLLRLGANPFTKDTRGYSALESVDWRDRSVPPELKEQVFSCAKSKLEEQLRVLIPSQMKHSLDERLLAAKILRAWSPSPGTDESPYLTLCPDIIQIMLDILMKDHSRRVRTAVAGILGNIVNPTVREPIIRAFLFLLENTDKSRDKMVIDEVIRTVSIKKYIFLPELSTEIPLTIAPESLIELLRSSLTKPLTPETMSKMTGSHWFCCHHSYFYPGFFRGQTTPPPADDAQSIESDKETECFKRS